MGTWSRNLVDLIRKRGRKRICALVYVSHSPCSVHAAGRCISGLLHLHILSLPEYRKHTGAKWAAPSPNDLSPTRVVVSPADWGAKQQIVLGDQMTKCNLHDAFGSSICIGITRR